MIKTQIKAKKKQTIALWSQKFGWLVLASESATDFKQIYILRTFLHKYLWRIRMPKLATLSKFIDYIFSLLNLMFLSGKAYIHRNMFKFLFKQSCLYSSIALEKFQVVSDLELLLFQTLAICVPLLNCYHWVNLTIFHYFH